MPSLSENTPPATNIEEQPLATLKSSFDVPEHAGESSDPAAEKPLASRLVDSKPVVRRGAYGELAALFAGGDVDFDEHASTLKKILLDNASNCHEAALDATIAFAQHAPSEAVTASAPSAARAIVDKHAAGKLQSKAIEALLCLNGAGDEAAAAVQSALATGAGHKVPKTRAAAAKALVAILRGFGGDGTTSKALAPLVVPLLEHRDKGVRDEGHALLGELRRTGCVEGPRDGGVEGPRVGVFG